MKCAPRVRLTILIRYLHPLVPVRRIIRPNFIFVPTSIPARLFVDRDPTRAKTVQANMTEIDKAIPRWKCRYAHPVKGLSPSCYVRVAFIARYLCLFPFQRPTVVVDATAQNIVSKIRLIASCP